MLGEKIFPWNHQTLFKHWACQDMGPWQLGCWHTAWTSFAHEFQFAGRNPSTLFPKHSKRTIRNEHSEVDHESCSSSTNLYPQRVSIGVTAAPNRSPIRSWDFFTWKITMPKQISYVCLLLRLKSLDVWYYHITRSVEIFFGYSGPSPSSSKLKITWQITSWRSELPGLV